MACAGMLVGIGNGCARLSPSIRINTVVSVEAMAGRLIEMGGLGTTFPGEMVRAGLAIVCKDGVVSRFDRKELCGELRTES